MSLNKREEKIINLLDPKTPVHMDDIIACSRLQPGEVLSILLDFEVRRLARQLPGKIYLADPSLTHFRSKTPPILTGEQRVILRMLDERKPRHADSLSEWSGRNPDEVRADLTQLELWRRCKRLRGEHYVKVVE